MQVEVEADCLKNESFNGDQIRSMCFLRLYHDKKTVPT